MPRQTTKVFDNKGMTFDRYTIVIGMDVYGMSDNPSSPQGFNQYNGSLKYRTGGLPTRSLGKRVKIKDLPKEVQKAIRQRKRSD